MVATAVANLKHGGEREGIMRNSSSGKIPDEETAPITQAAATKMLKASDR